MEEVIRLILPTERIPLCKVQATPFGGGGICFSQPIILPCVFASFIKILTKKQKEKEAIAATFVSDKGREDADR